MNRNDTGFKGIASGFVHKTNVGNLFVNIWAFPQARSSRSAPAAGLLRGVVIGHNFQSANGSNRKIFPHQKLPGQKSSAAADPLHP